MDEREKLMAEMLRCFPELPVDTVRAHVNLYPRNREALVAQLSRVRAAQSGGGGASEGGGAEGSVVYSNFEPSLGAAADIGSLPLPEPPPSLVITPPASPEKTARAGTRPSSAGGMTTSSVGSVPALSIAGALNVGYEEFLLQNQRERLRTLEDAYRRNETCLATLRREVMSKEKLLFQKTLQKSTQSTEDPNEAAAAAAAAEGNNLNITIDSLLALSQTNRQLAVQNSCLVTEVDLHSEGRALLGDLTNHNNGFYDNINPGPRDPLVELDPSGARRSASRESATSGAVNNARSAGAIATTAATGGGGADIMSWDCSECTFINHADLNACEMCLSPKRVTTARQDSSSSAASSSASFYQQHNHQQQPTSNGLPMTTTSSGSSSSGGGGAAPANGALPHTPTSPSN